MRRQNVTNSCIIDIESTNIAEIQYLKYDIFHFDSARIKCILHDFRDSLVRTAKFEIKYIM